MSTQLNGTEACVGLLAVFVIVSSCGCATTWQRKLTDQLPLFGHRNWIVVADSAYPVQSRPGIETVYTAADQLEVVEKTLTALESVQHVQPIVYLDAELPAVAKSDAPGIEDYRMRLSELLKGRTIQSVSHEQIIQKLDDAAKTFRVLILKTDMTLPYTSVFFELDCGYWNAEAEQRLRAALKH